MEEDALVLVHFSHPWSAAFGGLCSPDCVSSQTILLPSLTPSLLEKSLHGWEEERGPEHFFLLWASSPGNGSIFSESSNWTGLLQF